MAINEMTVTKVGCFRYDLVAGLEAVDAAGVKAASGRYLCRAWDITLEQDVLLFHRGIGNRDVSQKRFGVGMGRVL